MITTHNTLSDDDVRWGFQTWWPLRQGVNAGGIRDIIRNYIKTMRRRGISPVGPVPYEAALRAKL